MTGGGAAKVRDFVVRWSLLGVVGLIWELVARWSESFFFPPLSVIFAEMREDWFGGPPSHLFLSEALLTDILPSLSRAFAGWSLAILVGIVLGTALGMSDAFADFVEPPIDFMRAIPPVALLPLFIILLGLGTAMRVSLIAFGCTWPILLNTAHGMRSVDPVSLDTGKIFGASMWRSTIQIRIPAAAPKIFAGLRISVAIALILMIVSEMLAGGGEGIGVSLLVAQRAFRLPAMWAYVLLLGALGYLLNWVLSLAERRAIGWHLDMR